MRYKWLYFDAGALEGRGGGGGGGGCALLAEGRGCVLHEAVAPGS